MRMAVEKLYGKLKDKELPSKTFLAQKLEQVEENAPQAEDLRDVTSLEDAGMEAYNAFIDPSTFTLRIKPGRTATTSPATPEELRMRHRRLGFVWEMVKSKHLSWSWLPDRCVDAFRELSDHVLGSHVAGLRAPGGHAPSWSMVLVYEGELRKAAYRYNAPEIMSTFFVAFTLAGSERASSVEPTSLAMPALRRGGSAAAAKARARATPARSRRSSASPIAPRITSVFVFGLIVRLVVNGRTVSMNTCVNDVLQNIPMCTALSSSGLRRTSDYPPRQARPGLQEGMQSRVWPPRTCPGSQPWPSV